MKIEISFSLKRFDFLSFLVFIKNENPQFDFTRFSSFTRLINFLNLPKGPIWKKRIDEIMHSRKMDIWIFSRRLFAS